MSSKTPRLFTKNAGACLLAASLLAGASAQASTLAGVRCATPASIASVLYQLKPDFLTQDPALLSVPLSRAFSTALQVRWQCMARQGVCSVDWDPWTDSQDPEVQGMPSFETVSTSDSQATVRVSVPSVRYQGGRIVVPVVSQLKFERATGSCWQLVDFVTNRGQSLRALADSDRYHMGR